MNLISSEFEDGRFFIFTTQIVGVLCKLSSCILNIYAIDWWTWDILAMSRYKQNFG